MLKNMLYFSCSSFGLIEVFTVRKIYVLCGENHRRLS